MNKSMYKIQSLTENDITEMMHLFCSTVINVNTKDYTIEEAKDWISCGDNIGRWIELLLEHQFIGAFDEEGSMVGFSSMNEEGYLHSMFVHKDWQGKGVATLLLSEVEKMAREYEVKEITSEVSITARPFFEKRGYVVVKAQKHRAKKLELINFVMKKNLI